MSLVCITRSMGIDMGHCLPDHLGKCFRPHGHRYNLEATVTGQIQTEGSETGMVLDYGNLKTVLCLIEEEFDHRFVISSTDPRMAASIEAFGDGIVIVDCPPTAEFLAGLWASRIQRTLNRLGLRLPPRLLELTVWETPNCKATWTAA